MNTMKDTFHVKLAELETAGFNPPRRTRDEYLKPIASSIRTHGILAPILVTKEGGNGKYVIGDGHRRFAIAKDLKKAGDGRFDSVPVRVIEDMTAEMIYQTQFSARKPQGVEVGYVWARKPSALPKHYVNLYNRLGKVVGKPQLKRWCVDEYAIGVAPAFVSLVFSVYRYTENLLPRQKIEYKKEWMLAICSYIRNNEKHQRLMKRFVDKEIVTPKTLKDFIKKGVELPDLLAIT